MTAMSVCNAKFNGGGNWEQFVTDKLPFFRDIHLRVEQMSFRPQISVTNFRTRSVIQGIFEMPVEQKNMIVSLARDLGLQDEESFTPHVTFAYQYRRVERGQSELLDQEIRATLLRVFNEYNNSYVLAAPRLCFFNDMLEFITWNGEMNPFISVARSHDSFFGGGNWPRLGAELPASHASASRK